MKYLINKFPYHIHYMLALAIEDSTYYYTNNNKKLDK